MKYEPHRIRCHHVELRSFTGRRRYHSYVVLTLLIHYRLLVLLVEQPVLAAYVEANHIFDVCLLPVLVRSGSHGQSIDLGLSLALKEYFVFV